MPSVGTLRRTVQGFRGSLRSHLNLRYGDRAVSEVEVRCPRWAPRGERCRGFVARFARTSTSGREIGRCRRLRCEGGQRLSHETSELPTTRSRRQFGEVVVPPLDECDPFRAAPALDLLLEGKCLVDAVELMAPHDRHRPASPGACVRRSESEVVLSDASFEVDAAPGVEGAVGALEEVGPGHHVSLVGVVGPRSPRRAPCGERCGTARFASYLNLRKPPGLLEPIDSSHG